MKQKIIIALVALAIGVGAGYYFGYDHGFERAVGAARDISNTNN